MQRFTQNNRLVSFCIIYPRGLTTHLWFLRSVKNHYLSNTKVWFILCIVCTRNSNRESLFPPGDRPNQSCHDDKRVFQLFISKFEKIYSTSWRRPLYITCQSPKFTHTKKKTGWKARQFHHFQQIGLLARDQCTSIVLFWLRSTILNTACIMYDDNQIRFLLTTCVLRVNKN